MSRFATRKTGRLVLSGGCQCPGTPHDEDWIELRTQLGFAEIQNVTSTELLERAIVSWNLMDEDGEAPVDADHIGLLFKDAFDEIDAWFEANVTYTTVPKALPAPSRNGSREAASSTRGKQTGR